MRTLGILTIAVGLLSVAACSSADPTGDSLAENPPSESGNKRKSAPPEDNDPAPAPPAATPAPAPTPPAPDASATNGVKDADETDVDCGGAKAKGCADGKACRVATDCTNNICTGGTCKAPAVQTNYCQQLSASGCCNTLASTVEKFACIGVQFAGKEIACQGELALCGIGGIGGTPCGNLNKCCDQMQAEGYGGDAADCRSHNTGNASVCSSWLSQYRGMAWCD